MPAPTITALPDAPIRSESPATFTAKAEAWVAAIDGLTGEVNDFGAYLNSYSPSDTYIWSFFFTSTPTDAEVLALHVAGVAFTIPADFTAGLQSSVGTNPTSSFALDVQNNGVTIGTITVGTDGSVTATTDSGTSKSIAAGDVLKIVAPGTADATAADMAFTIIGVR